MQMRVTGRHIDVTVPIREHVERRLAKLEHIFHNLLDAHVILFPEGDEYVSDITVTGNHVTLHIRARDADLYAAVDRAVHKLEQQVRRHKDRVRRHKRHLSHAERDMQAAALVEQEWAKDEENADEDWSDEDTYELSEAEVATRRTLATRMPAGPMTLEEAMTSLESNGAQFLAFINPKSDDVYVLYRGPDGELGLITRS